MRAKSHLAKLANHLFVPKFNLGTSKKIALTAALLLIMASGCASSGAAPGTPQGQAGGIYVEQVPITAYMRSQVGTPNELSPLAPAEATNIRKVGDRWCCDLNGQARVFNGATSCWELQQK